MKTDLREQASAEDVELVGLAIKEHAARYPGCETENAWQRICASRGGEAVKPLKMEVFNDPSYYDMWAVRPVGVRDFNLTAHFNTEREARFAAQCFEAWTKPKGDAHARFAEIEPSAKWFGEVMAMLHGDGGHYLAKHGAEKAALDALDKYHALAAELERLRQAGMWQAAAMQQAP